MNRERINRILYWMLPVIGGVLCVLYVASAMTISMACAGVGGIPAVVIGSIIAGILYTILPAINRAKQGR